MRNVSGKVSTKLTVSFLVVAAIVVAVAIYSYFALLRIDSGVTTMFNQQLLPMHDLGDANAAVFVIHGDLNEYIDYPELRKELRAAIEADLLKIEKTLASSAELPLSTGERTAFTALQAAWTAYKPLVGATLDQIDAGDVEKAHANAVSGELAHQQEALDQAMETMLAANVATAKDAHDGSDVVIGNAIWLLAGGVLVGLLLALGLAYWISRSITRNLGQLKSAAEALAAGDLTRRVDIQSGDEIETLAHAFNNMAANLEQRVETERQAKQTLEAGTQNLSAAAAEILAAVNEHTASASEQSAAVNQVTATVSEAQAATQQSAAKATEVADLAQDALRVGQEGADSVANILAGMQDIRTKVEGIARNILALSEQTQQIGDIITTVTDIADQSNILAINAAIEAAKAGDQGKGFAVVAGEVRNLAEQSKQATAKVRSILGEIQKATNTAVLATEQGTRGVESGTTLTQRAGEVIGQLTGAIRGAAQAAQQIAASSRQQTVAMDQIAQAMREINQATVQFVAGARQSQTAAEGLNDLARQLLQLAARYNS